MRRFFLLSCLLLAACDSRSTFNYMKKDPHVKPLAEIKADLAFTCAYENVPEASAGTDMVFQYARWLQKNNQLIPDKSVDVEIERLYRIAAENDHYKANVNLQNGAMRQRFKLRGEEHLRLSQQLIDAGVATGYYFVGIFLQQGSAGLKQDPQMALRYFRKAADRGSALAQYLVGDKLDPIDIAPQIALKMYRCAAEQGNGEAGTALGIYLSQAGNYQDALEAFQLGVAAGSSTSASFIYKSFRNPPPTNELHYLDQQEDLDRAERYETISKILAGYSYANPKVPEINEILPLPPAKLPSWDGKLQWLEERLANVPPEKPSEALIQQLAKAKLLDPTSGRPLPASPDFIREPYRKLTCNSGQACPQSGYWKAEGFVDEIRRFEKGEIMPTLNVRRSHSRFLLADRITVAEENIEWILFGEA